MPERLGAAALYAVFASAPYRAGSLQYASMYAFARSIIDGGNRSGRLAERKGGQRGDQRERETERERESVCVCVCDIPGQTNWPPSIR